jgi:hypothetical protein
VKPTTTDQKKSVGVLPPEATRHTPTPWEYRSGDDNGFYQLGAEIEIGIYSPANSGFIVRAVNSYDDMLSALKAYGAVFAFPRNEFDREVCYDHCRLPGSSSDEHTERCKATKAAIAKAERGQ